MRSAYTLVLNLLAIICGVVIMAGCTQEQPQSIVGTWIPVDKLSRDRGAYETYKSDSSFTRQVSSSQVPYQGKYWSRGDSLFQLFQMPDSNVRWLDSLAEIKGVTPGGWLMGSFQLTWKGPDTLVMESGPKRYKARSVLVRLMN